MTAVKTAGTMRLRVDPVACDGFGYCAELLPELISVDEWGFPVVSEAPVPQWLLSLARRAVTECPRRALALVEEPNQAPVRGTVVAASTRRQLRK